MKENIAESILERVNKRVLSLSDRLTKQYKGVKPFGREELKSEDKLYYYDNLSPLDMDYLITKYGRETMNQMVYEMETLKARRKNYAR